MPFFSCRALRSGNALRRAASCGAAAALALGALPASASHAAALDADAAVAPLVYRSPFDSPGGVERGRTPWRDAHAAVLQEADAPAEYGGHAAHGHGHGEPAPVEREALPVASGVPPVPHDHHSGHGHSTGGAP